MKKVFKVHIEEVAPSWASNFAGFMDKSTKKRTARVGKRFFYIEN
ncbi:MAG TPA: hypothetical protein PKW49_10740 [Paludibacteraceae bacterium]|nr:hypothetical protein [Paludibacteraceae bacterium]HQF50842.1 hypothetical protein [Paludibacteraceae bacterium]HQJ89855.1 hypothetical protein [Paludibacteraceae bacterium]